MKELYETETAVCIKTTLIGPKKGEEKEKAETYPYIVVQTEDVKKMFCLSEEEKDGSDEKKQFIIHRREKPFLTGFIWMKITMCPSRKKLFKESCTAVPSLRQRMFVLWKTM